jgi:hypothetical protein
MSKRSIVYLCLAVVGVALVIGAIFLGYNVDWAGFQAYSDSQGYHSPKTLWDWLDLLIVPLVLGVGAFLLNRSEQRRQVQIAEQRAESDRKAVERRAEAESMRALDRIREDRLQAYLDRMQELLEKGLKFPPPESDLLRDVAMTRTLTVLRGLDGERKGALLLFLRDSELISKTGPIIPLHWADLNEANLSKTDLRETNLVGANLHSAVLTEADLTGADLSRAELCRANLTGANLTGADLTGANLSVSSPFFAKLTGADLTGANLTGANLTGANLRSTKYDDTTKWPDGFDPIAAGAKNVGIEPL